MTPSALLVFLGACSVCARTASLHHSVWRPRARPWAADPNLPPRGGGARGLLAERKGGEEPSWARALVPASAPNPYRVAMRVLPSIVLHACWSVLVVAVHVATGCRPRAPALLHTLLGGVLGLLLAFRTNQAYERFWSSCKSWSHLHVHLHNFARIAAQLSNARNANLYTSILRRLIAYPIALKQHLRRERDEKAYWPILWLSEIDAIMGARAPHLALLAELSLLITPMRVRDDGTGKDLAVWSALESTVSQLQAVAVEMERVVKLPPPSSYSLLTARFVFAYVGTLPFVLVELTRPLLVPPMMLLVAWALYSTEELAQLLEAPFGNALQPATVPMDMYCAHIVNELQQQAFVQRALMRRVADGSWIVKPEDLVPPPRQRPAPNADDPSGGGGGVVTDV